MVFGLARGLMSETITLAHISDVHLAPLAGFHPRYWNVKRGLGFLNWHQGRRFVHRREVADAIARDALAQEPDHIAVTGDLANLGLPGEYDLAFAWLAALGSADRVSVVPGNHDIYTARMHGASCLERWAPFMTSDAWGAGIGAARRGFPYVRRRGPMAIIGLNSAVPTPPFVASGRLGREQIESVAPLLERVAAEGLARVVLIHHPPLPGQNPPRRGLEDAEDFTRVLERAGAELVLHGHNHRDMLAWRQWAAGHIPVIGIASGSVARAHKDEYLARYNLIRIARNGAGFEIDCVTRGLDGRGSVIAELSRRRLANRSGA
jgi:3',5'-cyclic AMP phosphodiesterase CpdA